MKPKALIFVYGEGGHNAQMQRLFGYLDIVIKENKTIIVALNDSIRCEIPSSAVQVILPVLREKKGSMNIIQSLGAIIYSIKVIGGLFRRYDCRALVSTGPGIALGPALLCRLLGKTVIHVETWSRFSTASISGKLMYHLAHKFYVQNQEQMKVYPKAEWSGRL